MSKKVFGVVLAAIAVSCSSASAQCCNSGPVVQFENAPMVQSFDVPMVWDSGYVVIEPVMTDSPMVDNSWTQPSFSEMPVEMVGQFENEIVIDDWNQTVVYDETPMNVASEVCGCVCESPMVFETGGVIFSANEMMFGNVGEIVAFEAPVDQIIEGAVVESTFTSDINEVEAPVEEASDVAAVEDDSNDASEETNSEDSEEDVFDDDDDSDEEELDSESEEDGDDTDE